MVIRHDLFDHTVMCFHNSLSLYLQCTKSSPHCNALSCAIICFSDRHALFLLLVLLLCCNKEIRKQTANMMLYR